MSGISKKNIELLSASRRMDKKRREAVKKIIYLAAAPIILSCIIVLTAYTYQVKTTYYKSETEKILNFLEKEEIQSQEERIEALQKDISLFREFREDYKIAKKYMNSLVSAAGEQTDLIRDKLPEGIQIHQISFRNNRITLTGSAQNYRQIPVYIRRLEDTGAFVEILYDGFTYSSTGSYEFTLTCYL